MPHHDDEYQIPYLSIGHAYGASPVHGAAPRPKKRKVNIGFQHPGNEFPPKPKKKRKRK